ncbi:unnamed protein product, partial [Rotaria magnacalcarata]
MVDAIRMLHVPMMPQQMVLFVVARMDMLIVAQVLSSNAQVNNGGCDSNATCSHDASTNGVVCSCKNGFVNTGCGTTVKCT